MDTIGTGMMKKAAVEGTLSEVCVKNTCVHEMTELFSAMSPIVAARFLAAKVAQNTGTSAWAAVLCKMKASAAAGVLDEMSPETAVALLRQLNACSAGQILLFMIDARAVLTLKHFDMDFAAESFGAMPAEQCVCLLQKLGAKWCASMICRMEAQDAANRLQKMRSRFARKVLNQMEVSMRAALLIAMSTKKAARFLAALKEDAVPLLDEMQDAKVASLFSKMETSSAAKLVDLMSEGHQREQNTYRMLLMLDQMPGTGEDVVAALLQQASLVCAGDIIRRMKYNFNDEDASARILIKMGQCQRALHIIRDMRTASGVLCDPAELRGNVSRGGTEVEARLTGSKRKWNSNEGGTADSDDDEVVITHVTRVDDPIAFIDIV